MNTGIRKDHLRKGETVSWYDSVIAGSVSGVFARMATAPMDTVKIRYQLQPVQEDKYKGIASTVRTIMKEEGLRALWKGNVPATAMYVVYGAVQFGSYSWFNNVWSAKFPQFSQQGQTLTVGALAGMTSSVVSYPLDLLRTRLIANRTSHRTSVAEECRQMWLNEGVRGFFTGMSTAMTTVTLSTAIMFLTYETVNIVCENHEKEFWSRPVSASSGIIAGFVSKTMVFPIDTLRRRMQVMNSKRTVHFTEFPDVYHEYRSKSSTAIIYKILRQEGVSALYRGLTMGLCKSVPTTAISLFVYERTMDLFDHSQRWRRST
ncbi:Tpc1 [Kluyveromyces lactis]|nr:Tpc1 [Kluyveromyces lactis]